MGKLELLRSTIPGLEEYFEEVDAIRIHCKNWIKEYHKSNPKSRRKGGGVWENSFFYVGKTTISVGMTHMALPYFGRVQLRKSIERLFPGYIVVDLEDHGLRVYIK